VTAVRRAARRSVAAGLALVTPALLPTLIPDGAPASVTTAPAAASLARPAPPAARAAVEDIPDPPPVDAEQLPSDGPPAALPGVRQAYRCADEPHRPDPAALPGLLWGQRALGLSRLGRLGTGATVRIAVIDTGVARHPLLAGRLVDGGDYVAGGTGLADCDGHGTAVAGIAASAADSGTGFSGVAPTARVISIRQSSPSFTVPGQGERREPAGDLSTLADAVVHAVDLDADVINISEVACAAPNAPGAARLRAAVRAAVLRDVVVVAAAGNTGTGAPGECPSRPETGTVVYPGWFDDDVLTVAAVGPDGLASRFSFPGPWVDVAAPGERLVSLAATGSGLTDQLAQVSARSPIEGTSFAAPAVAGLAALVRARYPQLTARQVMDRITATAAQRGAGRTDTVGYGVVDPLAALTRTPVVLPPPSGIPAAGDTGVLRLGSAGARPGRAGPAALWAGVLALLATLVAGAEAVGRSRAGGRPGSRHRWAPGTGTWPPTSPDGRGGGLSRGTGRRPSGCAAPARSR
jgi:membrane-anchored mycosin MYCP